MKNDGSVWAMRWSCPDEESCQMMREIASDAGQPVLRGLVDYDRLVDVIGNEAFAMSLREAVVMELLLSGAKRRGIITAFEIRRADSDRSTDAWVEGR